MGQEPPDRGRDHDLRQPSQTIVAALDLLRRETELSARGGGLAIEVWNTGAGVPPHMLERIFEAFERADSVGNEGLGLGLWIVQKTAQLLGHTIEVRSVAGSGSCFSIRCSAATRRSAEDAGTALNAGALGLGALRAYPKNVA